jgi:hypothetical protein
VELHGVFLPVAEQRCTTNATQPDAAPDDAAWLAEATARTALPVGNGLPWPSPLGACDVASTSGINTSFRVSCESRWRARSGKDKPSCNAGGLRRRWTEPAKTHQQRSRCVGQQAWKRKGLTLITPARGSSQEQTVSLRFEWPPQVVNRSLHNM